MIRQQGKRQSKCLDGVQGEVMEIKGLIERVKRIPYRYLAILLYFPVYLICFNYLEKHYIGQLHYLTLPVDYMIPFVEIFIVPYFLWFLFIAAAVVYFILYERDNYVSMMIFLCTGMTVFLVVSAIYPTALDLRPAYFERDNIFTEMVRFLYSIDTPSNVFPSIHVYNSLGVCLAVRNSRAAEQKKWLTPACCVLAGLIILATMFLKQHSVLDVVSACVLAMVVAPVFRGSHRTVSVLERA